MASSIADFVLVVHFGFVLFVVGGLAAIWIGAAAGWRWVRNWWLRAAHVAAIGLVVAESLVGIVCPLTAWEDTLRGTQTATTFVARWIRRVLFYAFPEWMFTAAYLLFALAVVATWWRVRPQRGRPD